MTFVAVKFVMFRVSFDRLISIICQQEKQQCRIQHSFTILRVHTHGQRERERETKLMNAKSGAIGQSSEIL